MRRHINVFEEARRRFESFANGKPLHQAWVGLDYLSNYKEAIDDGFFETLHGDTTPRILHWFILTPKGVDEYNMRFGGQPPKYKNGVVIKID